MVDMICYDMSIVNKMGYKLSVCLVIETTYIIYNYIYTYIYKYVQYLYIQQTQLQTESNQFWFENSGKLNLFSICLGATIAYPRADTVWKCQRNRHSFSQVKRQEKVKPNTILVSWILQLCAYIYVQYINLGIDWTNHLHCVYYIISILYYIDIILISY